MSDLIRRVVDPEPDEEPIPLWVKPGDVFAKIYSPKGIIGVINCLRDDDGAIAATKQNKPTLLILPQFKLQLAPPVIMVSRKAPFERQAQGGQYMRESHHPGVYCEFYNNWRGRFLRINDAYRHYIYELRRAHWINPPPDLPPEMHDLDLGWYPEQ